MQLQAFFEQRISAGEHLVLVTVIETRGSTYSKAGGQMIIDGDGNFCGMLSGGCLEGDLVERARNVINTGAAETATYDLGDDDELWGLGVGCDGAIQVLLQPLLPEHGYQPFKAIVDVMNGTEKANLAIVVSADFAEVAAGASLVSHCGEARRFGMDEALASCIASGFVVTGPTELRQLDTPAGRCAAFYCCISPLPSLLVLGAGPDAEPVVRMASELGWRITVCDHRPGYISRRSFPETVGARCCPVEELSKQVSLDATDMAIVMSHHLASDRAYLRQLAATRIGYIGLLGPAGRRDRLLGESTELAKALEGRLRAPVGIDLGGRGPGPIALAIVAQMQQFLFERV